jgi:hypothetical protein
MNDKEVYCPECGCDEVTIYDDGYCQCNGCGYEWYVE